MTKKKKILNGIIFFIGLIVFVIYYYKDKGDMEKVEKEQENSAVESVDSIFEVFDNEEFEVNELEQDSILTDSL